MPYKRGISPLTTWHSQSGLLLISATWGLSYLMPTGSRVAFSEVFPPKLADAGLPMRLWGVILLVFAAAALVAERVIAHTRGTHPIGWRAGYGSHMALTAAYGTLAFAAIFESLSQVDAATLSWSWWGQIVTASSRTVLWGYIAYLHSTYARLPRPVAKDAEK